jgi:hypothetical protein
MPDTQQRRLEEAEQQMDSTAEDLEHRSEQLGEQIQEAKQTWSQATKETGVTEASGDWEDTEPDDAIGEDPSGFDDPESVDLDDDDLPDDD